MLTAQSPAHESTANSADGHTADVPPDPDELCSSRARPAGDASGGPATPRLDVRGERGAQAMEYAMLAGAAVVVVLVIMQVLRSDFFTGMLENLISTVIERVIDAVGGDAGGSAAAGSGGATSSTASAAGAATRSLPAIDGAGLLGSATDAAAIRPFA